MRRGGGQSSCSIRALVVRIRRMSPCVSFLKTGPFSESNHRRTGSILKPLKVIKPSEELFVWVLRRKRKKNKRHTARFLIGKPPCNLLNVCLHTSDLQLKSNSTNFSQKRVYGSWWVLQHMWEKKAVWSLLWLERKLHAISEIAPGYVNQQSSCIVGNVGNLLFFFFNCP